ncbi:MAG: hypothetical protein C0404_12750 [Verrucomicrobia bacterium]|nr:hypothetical protein [Verrucomicrobiota bacterium]
MISKHNLCAIVMLAAVAAMAFEPVPAPDRGKPWPGNAQNIPYEDVLDVSDLVIEGTVKSFDGGRIKLTDVRSLLGRQGKAGAEVIYAGTFSDNDMDKGKSVTLICPEQTNGMLRLAGDPPKGAGLMVPGPDLLEALVVAAKDPAKGYNSTNPAVKLSSAYRLACAWVAAPADGKPKLPDDIIDTLLDGLTSDPLRDRNVNSAARNAINLLLDADINKLFGYSVNAPDFKRDDKASDVRIGWRQTVNAIQAQRREAAAGKTTKPPETDFNLKRATLFIPLESTKADKK